MQYLINVVKWHCKSATGVFEQLGGREQRGKNCNQRMMQDESLLCTVQRSSIFFNDTVFKLFRFCSENLPAEWQFSLYWEKKTSLSCWRKEMDRTSAETASCLMERRFHIVCIRSQIYIYMSLFAVLSYFL